MKKLSLFVVLFLGLFYGKSFAATLTINNTSSCDVVMKIYAHDATLTDCGSFQSYTVSLPSLSTPLVLSAPTVLNPPCGSGPCWGVGGSIGTTGVWDMVGVQMAGEDCFGFVAESKLSCGMWFAEPTWQSHSCSSCCILVTWQTDVSGNVTVTIADTKC